MKDMREAKAKEKMRERFVQASSQKDIEFPEPEADDNIVVDDDGFLIGVKVPEERATRGYYVLLDGKYKGYTIQYRALLPIDYLMWKDSPLTQRMAAIGLDSRNAAQVSAYQQSLSVIEINRIYFESSQLIVVIATEKPVLMDAPPERCPSNRISIHDLSDTDIMCIRREIEALSGVSETEETFREADAEDSPDSGEPESASAAESNDSDPDRKSVGESTE